ncbi:MAG TPA: glycosyltransferase family 4 protein [Candidatus Krumholzibacteria bacterium]|nr:glycosyltransferase family 4 protein [Candidatus Krumholzibacteria bacterium]
MTPEVGHRVDASISAPGANPRRRLRVLVSSGIFPNRVLVNRGIYNLKAATALTRYCDVRVVAPVPYLPSFLRAPGYEWYSQVPRRDDVGSFHVEYPRYFVTPKVGRSLHGIFLYLSVRSLYRDILRQFAPDVILGYFAYPYGFANVLLGRAAGVPVVTFCRGSDIHSIARKRSQARLIAWALRRSAKVFAVSESLKSDIVALGVAPSHVVVIPNGIEPERFTRVGREAARARVGLPASGPVVVCVSRLSHEKGVDVLVDAAALLKTPGARVVIVGDGPEEISLKARAQRAGVGDRVLFAGARPHADVPLWIAAADVAALSSRKEGHPNALVEYLACGRPAVATRVGGVPEILTSRDFGTMVEPDDAPALAVALDEALARSWNEEAIAQAGCARDWDAVARDIVRELEPVVAARATVGSA